jgi:hypothetical protein
MIKYTIYNFKNVNLQNNHCYKEYFGWSGGLLTCKKPSFDFIFLIVYLRMGFDGTKSSCSLVSYCLEVSNDGRDTYPIVTFLLTFRFFWSLVNPDEGGFIALPLPLLDAIIPNAPTILDFFLNF